MRPLKIILSALIATIISMVLHTVAALVEMPYYLMANYFSVWSKLMMPTAGPPPTSFYVYSAVFALIGYLLFALVYNVVKSSLPGKAWKKGLLYGLLVFAVASVPSSLSLVLLINLPVGLVGLWAAEGLIMSLFAGLVTAGINR